MDAFTGQVGVLLRPGGARAALVTVDPPADAGGAGRKANVLAVAEGQRLDAVLRDVLQEARRCRVGVPAVTVDISPLLLDAVAQPVGLPPVATIRVVPRPFEDPSLARLPAPAVERLVAARFTVTGGHDLRGNELRPIDHDCLARVCEQLAETGIRNVAVVAAGSQACPTHEHVVADAVQSALPGARISVAGDYGGQGLIAREATVVLDSALATLAEHITQECEAALGEAAPGAALRTARGDGGYVLPSRIRAMPVVAVGATAALELVGAAFVAGEQDCRVLVPGADGPLTGEVRQGLAVVGPTEADSLGCDLVVPTALLTPQPEAPRQRQPGAERSRTTGQPVVRPALDVDTLACVGAAVSRPMAWADEVAFIESAGQLDLVRRAAVDRATAFLMTNGAAPGSAYLADVSAVALPYSAAGTVRIRVRVVGEPDTESGHQHELPRAGPGRGARVAGQRKP